MISKMKQSDKIPSRFALRAGLDYPLDEEDSIQEDPVVLTQAVLPSRKRLPKPIDGSSSSEDLTEDPQTRQGRKRYRSLLYDAAGVSHNTTATLTPKLPHLKVDTERDSQHLVCVLQNAVLSRDKEQLQGRLDFWVERCPLDSNDKSWARIYQNNRLLLELRTLCTELKDGWDFNQRLLYWRSNDYSFQRRRFNLLRPFGPLNLQSCLDVISLFLEEEKLQDTPLLWKLKVPTQRFF